MDYHLFLEKLFFLPVSEELYPQFDLKGPAENITEENIDLLLSCLERMPQEPLQRCNLELRLAMETDTNKETVDWELLEEGGHYSLDNKVMVFFNGFSFRHY